MKNSDIKILEKSILVLEKYLEETYKDIDDYYIDEIQDIETAKTILKVLIEDLRQ